MTAPSPENLRVSSAVRLGFISVLVKCLGALWGILVARSLGAEDFGRFAFALAVLGMVQVVSGTGAAAYVTREVTTRGITGPGGVLRSVLRLQLMLGSLGAAALLAAGLLGVFDLDLLLVLVLGVTILLASVAQVGRGVLRGTGRTTTELVLQLGGYALLCAAAVVAAGAGGLTLVVASYPLLVLPVILGALIHWRRIRGPLPPGNGTEVRVSLGEVFRGSFWLNVLGITGALFTRMDVVIVGATTVAAQVGAYAAASQLIFAGLAIPSLVAVALLAGFVRARSDLGSLVARWCLVFLGCGALATLVTWVAAPLVPMVLGAEFAPAVTVLRILAWGLPAGFVSAVFVQGFIAAGQEWRTVVVMALSTAVAAVTISVTATTVGITGVALGLVAILWCRAVGETVWFASFVRRRRVLTLNHPGAGGGSDSSEGG